MRYSHLLLLLMVTFRCASAQSPPGTPSSTSPDSPYLSNKFNPSMAIIIVILISAFFLLGFFSIYIRSCAGDRLAPRSTNGNVAGTTTSRRGPRGLDPDILSSFPTMIYSEVKNHKIGLSSLECAVCLMEFDDDDELRLLPKCSHVFHPDCIDAWLSAHVTCPVCRAKLDVDDDNDLTKPDPIPIPEPSTDQAEPQAAESAEHRITIEADAAEGGSETELAELERFINMKRSRSRFPRSHSTGHSLLVLPGENLDRFTLRLPEEIKREVLVRSGSVAMPRGGGGGEGSVGGRRGRSIRLGGSRSEKWGSFLIRSFSAKWPNWGRKGEGEGSRSMKGEGSTTSKRGKFLGSIGSIKEVHH